MLNSRLTIVELAAFAAPSALLFMFRAASYVIPALYSARFGFSLADLAGILFVMRTAEALLQIPAGYMSDATRHARWGRKPMIFACIVVATVAATWAYFGSLRWQARNAETKQYLAPED